MKPGLVAGGYSRPPRKKVSDGNASQEDIVHRSFVDLSFGPIRMDMMKWVILNRTAVAES